MRLQQLVYFVKVVETGGANSAARELFVSQPAVSAGIRELEEEQKKLASLIKTVKKLNGLGIKGEEKMLRLAAFACEERFLVRKARAQRLEQEKQRGSI